MTNSSTTSEPKTAKPPQFTIRSLMILTAAVAVFFALLTQAPGIITACYVLGASGIWIYPKYWRGIFTAVLCFFSGIASAQFSRFSFSEVELLLGVSQLFCLASALYAVSSTNRFDKIVGVGSLVLLLLIPGYTQVVE